MRREILDYFHIYNNSRPSRRRIETRCNRNSHHLSHPFPYVSNLFLGRILHHLSLAWQDRWDTKILHGFFIRKKYLTLSNLLHCASSTTKQITASLSKCYNWMKKLCINSLSIVLHYVCKLLNWMMES